MVFFKNLFSDDIRVYKGIESYPTIVGDPDAVQAELEKFLRERSENDRHTADETEVNHDYLARGHAAGEFIPSEEHRNRVQNRFARIALMGFLHTRS